MKLLLLLLGIISFHAVAKAQASPSDGDVNQLINALSNLNTLSGRFTQEIFSPDGVLIQESRGEFQIEKPNKFYWKVLPPFEQIVLGDAQKVMVYDPDLEQAAIYKKEKMAVSPAIILSNDSDVIKEQFNVTMIENDREKTLITYQLISKNINASDFSKLLLVFDKAVLSEITFEDQLGQSTQVTFSALNGEIKFDSSLFDFRPPVDTDIILQ